MNVEANDIWRTIGYLEEDARGQLAKLGDLRRMLATIDLPKTSSGVRCELCGVEKLNQAALGDHLWVVHGLDEFAPANIEHGGQE